MYIESNLGTEYVGQLVIMHRFCLFVFLDEERDMWPPTGLSPPVCDSTSETSSVMYISDSGQYNDVIKYLLLFILVDKLRLNIGKCRSLLRGGLTDRSDRLKPKV